MIKDHLRDYATAAFRNYARCGFPTYEELRKIIFDAALESSRREINRMSRIPNPTQQAVINAESAVDERQGELLDILAVENALKIMKDECKKAVEQVYFVDAQNDFECGDIKERVTRASIEIPASERQIYYWLRTARYVFAVERGLRV